MYLTLFRFSSIKNYGRPSNFWSGSKSKYSPLELRDLLDWLGTLEVESRVLDIMFLGDESEGELEE